jgi:methylphosphotriester-DNA--protein-cysteine methyltransferase
MAAVDMLQTAHGAAKQSQALHPAFKTSQSVRVLLPYSHDTAIEAPRRNQSEAPKTFSLADAFSARTDEARWAILSSRKCPPSAVAPFIYAVTTTHIYCRPTCPARLARRSNVVFFDTGPDAVKAGYRACRRCKPDVEPEAGMVGGEAVQAGDGEEGRRKVLKAVEVIKEKASQGQRIGLRELSEEVGLSRWHLLRIFRKRWGVTPKEMADGVLVENDYRRHASGSQTPDTITTSSAETASSASHGLPRTPETGFELLDGTGLAGMDDQFMSCDNGLFDVDLTTSELWMNDESVEDLLRDLFPEVYQQDTTLRP